MKKILSLCAVAALAFAACGTSPDAAADALYKQADAAYTAGDYQSAKIYIDSIRATYPTVLPVRRKAIELMRSVELAEQQRTLDYCNETLAHLEARRDSLLPAFELERADRYQDEGSYIIPSQALRVNVYNSLLRARVTESGKAFITSLYRGKRIAHSSVRVSAGGSYAECDKAFMSHTFRNLGVNNERLDFLRGEDGGIMDFIAHATTDITVELRGEQGTHKYTLRSSDAAAVARVVELSRVLQAIAEYRNMAAEAERHITFVQKSRERFSRDSISVAE